MTFYGTLSSLVGWKKILEKEFGKIGTEIIDVDNRLQFDVDITKPERDLLQENYWYAVEEGQDMPWNWRIAWS